MATDTDPSPFDDEGVVEEIVEDEALVAPDDASFEKQAIDHEVVEDEPPADLP